MDDILFQGRVRKRIDQERYEKLLRVLVEQEKKIRFLEDRYESLAYRFLEERERRREDSV